MALRIGDPIEARIVLRPSKMPISDPGDPLDHAGEEVSIWRIRMLTPVDLKTGLRQHIAVVCGSSDCGTDVADIFSVAYYSSAPAADDEVVFYPGFGLSRHRIYELTPRAERQWRHAQSQRTHWQDFVARARRPRYRKPVPDPTHEALERLLCDRSKDNWDPQAVRTREPSCSFRCPVCGRVNTLHVPPGICRRLLSGFMSNKA